MSEFHFQAPGASKFLDSVRAATAYADRGLGVFAFASSGGVRRFVEALGLGSTWVLPKQFHLVVGVDAITNPEALYALGDWVAASHGALTAEVFMHSQPASTFHPKFAIFSRLGAARVLTGSGNLTTKGLGQASVSPLPPGNWEAFSVQDFMGAEASTLETDAEEWLRYERGMARLRPLNDPEVMRRAMANGLLRFAAPTPASTAGITGGGGAAAGPSASPAHGGWLARAPTHGAGATTPSLTIPPTPEPAPLDSEVLGGGDLLIKELSKNRQGQADVGREILEEFFGYTGAPRTILVQYVDLTNVVWEPVEQQVFENKSHNFRVELRESADIEYTVAPDGGRMLAVVVRLDARSFRYTVVPVAHPEYQILSNLLGPIAVGGRRLMRAARFNVTTLQTIWPAAPSNLKPVISNTFTP